jgi:hypothetical protein
MDLADCTINQRWNKLFGILKNLDLVDYIFKVYIVVVWVADTDHVIKLG